MSTFGTHFKVTTYVNIAQIDLPLHPDAFANLDNAAMASRIAAR